MDTNICLASCPGGMSANSKQCETTITPGSGETLQTKHDLATHFDKLYIQHIFA
jgi:Na+-transporting NADH:ubiquinone oxidoreductase subunit NqrF